MARTKRQKKNSLSWIRKEGKSHLILDSRFLYKAGRRVFRASLGVIEMKEG